MPCQPRIRREADKHHSIGAHWIPLDVFHHGQQMAVGLNGKRLEAALIQVSGNSGCVAERRRLRSDSTAIQFLSTVTPPESGGRILYQG